MAANISGLGMLETHHAEAGDDGINLPRISNSTAAGWRSLYNAYSKKQPGLFPPAGSSRPRGVLSSGFGFEVLVTAGILASQKRKISAPHRTADVATSANDGKT